MSAKHWRDATSVAATISDFLWWMAYAFIFVLAWKQRRRWRWHKNSVPMNVDPDLPGNVAVCPADKQIGDTLDFFEIMSEVQA